MYYLKRLGLPFLPRMSPFSVCGVEGFHAHLWPAIRKWARARALWTSGLHWLSARTWVLSQGHLMEEFLHAAQFIDAPILLFCPRCWHRWFLFWPVAFHLALRYKGILQSPCWFWFYSPLFWRVRISCSHQKFPNCVQRNITVQVLCPWTSAFILAE